MFLFLFNFETNNITVEQHEETDYFFNVPVGNRAGGNGAGSVGAADAVAERGASSDYGECGESSAYTDLFGYSDDEGTVVLRTSCYADSAAAVCCNAATCLRI